VVCRLRFARQDSGHCAFRPHTTSPLSPRPSSRRTRPSSNLSGDRPTSHCPCWPPFLLILRDSMAVEVDVVPTVVRARPPPPRPTTAGSRPLRHLARGTPHRPLRRLVSALAYRRSTLLPVRDTAMPKGVRRRGRRIWERDETRKSSVATR
jgi:hypothetical protein